MRAAIILLSLLITGRFASGQKPVVLVVTADAEDYLLAAGGTVASMVDKGADAYLIRVTNDEKNSWELTPEETSLRARAESESAATILGVKDVVSLGFRAAELADVPFTTLRDRLIIYIRHYRPTVLFIPNPYVEYERVLDRFYTGRAAEDAWRSAAIDNFVPPFGALGLKAHLTPELYYYSQPVDPRRRELEGSATFVPEFRTVDIASTFSRKVKAVQALRTANYAAAMRLKARFTATGRRLALLDTVSESSINRLAEENARGLAKIAAEGSAYTLAEEFRYAGVSYRIPRKYLQ